MGSMKKFWQNMIVPVFMLATVIVLSLLVCRAYLQYRMKEALALPSLKGVESLEQVAIGGINQYVLLRGESRKHPVLLFLHGGPGMPMIPFSHAMPFLEKHFIVVHWDQRGAGKSRQADIPPGSMTVEQFISDTHDMADFLRNRFNVPKIYLAGHSWGSLIGLLTAARYPDMFYAYAGVSQITNMGESEELSYRFALKEAESRGSSLAAAELRRAGPPPYRSLLDLFTQRKWVENFGGDFYADPGLIRLVELAFSSPYYSVGDLCRLLEGFYVSLRALWDEFYAADLFRDVPKLAVPAYFFEGVHDRAVPSALVKRYSDALEAQKKEIVWLEGSGHWPHLEEPEKFSALFVKKVLGENPPVSEEPKEVKENP